MWLTDAAHAGGWTWFHGDIGLASPFVSSSPPTTNGIIRPITKGKAPPSRADGGSKVKSLSHPINAR